MMSELDPPIPRAHGAVRDPDHPEFFQAEHRYLVDAADLAGQPERGQVVDNYNEQVQGEREREDSGPDASAG